MHNTCTIITAGKMARRRRLDEATIQHQLAELPSDSESDGDWQDESEEILNEVEEGYITSEYDYGHDDGLEEEEEEEGVERENDPRNVHTAH